MKKYLFGLFLFLFLAQGVRAETPPDEGMWLPMLVERLNYTDMQRMGLHLTAEELYSINHSSLKDAIVSMGFFCTGEIVSDKGLYLTNHHCGYTTIQANSSVDHDYLTDGFWAKTYEDELPMEGLIVYTLNYMDDVTSKILANVSDTMSEENRNAVIGKAIGAMKKEKSEDGKFRVVVKSFFDGNEFYMFVYHQYKDVRLVGAPPSSVGKFGGDTDNWMWPRHTGDFSMFRIYTAPDGSATEYSKDNVPLKPQHFLPVSLKGVKKNDFAMIWGYPGTTDRYMTSYGIQDDLNHKDPTIIEIRDAKLKVMKAHMNTDAAIRIKYAAKHAQTANYWKYFIGQSRGLKRLKVYDKKKDIEDNFQIWAESTPERKAVYGDALKMIEEGYKKTSELTVPMQYMQEAVFQGPEFIYYSFGAYQLYMTMLSQASKKGDDKAKFNDAIKDQASNMLTGMMEQFKNYDLPTDKDLFIELIGMYFNNVDKKYQAFSKDKNDNKTYLIDILNNKYKGNISKWADVIYNKSIFVDSVKLHEFLKSPNLKKLENDPGFVITLAMVNGIRAIYSEMDKNGAEMDKGQRLFVDGIRKMNPNKTYSPNANSTLRMTYGQVQDYIPGDAMHYDFFTTLDGVMEKEDATNEEFIVPAKLKALYNNKDFGQYADADGSMHVCFLTNNDITGGNSGSPVINGDGQLIGIAFDGNWEAMSGDIFFENKIQRTISVDIRYVLFLIDKLGGAKYLVDEMTLIK
ncbi:MAG: serine protease [Bacteroidetes bacterium CG2_30_33_31]|nr:MAG: serine protease [Bacteroidetes bacterium CG2_30_33_31]